MAVGTEVGEKWNTETGRQEVALHHETDSTLSAMRKHKQS